MTDFATFLDEPVTPSANMPAGTTGTQFLQFLDQPEQMTGLKREVALPASSFAKGLAITAGLPGTLQEAGNKYISDPLLRFFGRDPNAQTEAMKWSANPATSAEFTGMTRNMGITDRPDLMPQTEREKIEAAGFQGAGAALPFAALGGAPALIPTLAGGAGGGVGSMYGERVGGYYGYPRLGAFLGGLAGGIGGQTLGNLGVRGYNAIAGNYGPMGQAYRDAGVPINFTPNAKVAAYSSQSLGGSGRTLSLAKQESDAFGQSVQDTAASLGKSGTLQDLGDAAQQAGKQWIDTFKQASSASHEAVSQAVGPSAPVVPTATQTVLADIKSAAGGNPAAEAFLKSGLVKDMEGMVASAPGGTIPWQTARAIRSRIGEYLENPELIADAGTAQAKRLYGALTEDLRATAAASSNPKALQLFDLTNKFTSQGHDFIENVLSPVMNKSSPDAARWIVNSAKSGDHVVGPLRSEIPKLADEVAAFKLRDMALAPNGAQNAAGTTVSPGSFLTDWNALSPEAKSALYADPQVANKINGLATIAGDVKARQAFLNTSKTAHHGALTATALAAAEGAKTGFETGGMPGAVAGAATGAAVIPGFNYGLSLFGANRPLARMLAAEGPPTFPGQGLLSGAAGGGYGLLSGQRPAGFLGGP